MPTLETLIKDVNAGLELYQSKYNNEKDKDKQTMYKKAIDRIKAMLDNKNVSLEASELIANAKDVLSALLDKEKGKSVSDNSIFFNLPRYYEMQFHKDMSALNVIKISFFLIRKPKFRSKSVRMCGSVSVRRLCLVLCG
jgi:cysteinyl-tRNA synthetase